MIKIPPSVVVAVALSACLPSVAATTSRRPLTIDPEAFAALAWREVGPYRGGRSAAVEGVASEPQTYWFGSTGGGVWKTSDGGRTWANMSDGFFGGSIGAVAVAPADPNVVYVGTGEKTVRGNVSHGDGMWKSTDAGRTWAHVGLADSRHIPRVRVHPQDPNLVYAAVLGHLFGPNAERGVFRSRDGGGNWERVLFANEDAGAIDLVLDPTNPRTLYAATWQVRRTPYSLESGGPGSALWKSTDGGDTWMNLSTRPGFPTGTLGIIGITVSPTAPDNLYAIVEAAEGGVLRSRDAGLTWEKTNESRDLRQRAWYYSRIYADPRDAEVVYVLNVGFHRSQDGGRTFTTIDTPHGDNHDLWIAPDDALRMVEANDGGANVTTDGGRTWTAQDNQPTAQIYRVSTDNAFPYRLLGGQQDNTALRLRHRSMGAGIGADDWEPTAGGESGYVVAKPDQPEVVFGGSYGGYLTRLDHRSDELRDVNPWPDNPMGHGAEGATERFQWNFPLLFSPHDPDTLYAASQHLWRSRDGGASWQRISGDLTRNDPSRMGPSGGPITKDNTSVEYYGTIFAAAESPLAAGTIWAGSDDGRVHLTRDGGATWQEVTSPAMPRWLMINAIEASPFAAGTAYLAGTLYKQDDLGPQLWRTRDWGASWTRIDRGIAADHFTRVVRADRHRQGLLYAGTERGVYVSFDDGEQWSSLQLGLPIVPVTDLAVRDGDLVAATQGRGFWILDDLSPLQQWQGVPEAPVHLFSPRTSWRTRGRTPATPPPGEGTNAPQGVLVSYWIADSVAVGTPVTLTFLAADGGVVRELVGEVKAREPKPQALPAGDRAALAEGAEGAVAAQRADSKPDGQGEKDEEKDQEDDQAKDPEKEKEKEKEKERNRLPDSHPGLNRFAWDLRYPPASDFTGMVLWGGDLEGPRAVPGSYTVRLTVGDHVQTAVAVVQQDPRSTATQADLEAQQAFLLAASRKLTAVHEAITRIREVRRQLGELRERAGKADDGSAVVTAAQALDRRMTTIEEALYQTKNRSPQDPLNFPIRLNDKLASVASSAATGDFAPTVQQLAVAAQLTAAIDTQLTELTSVWENDLPALVALAAGVPAIR